MEFAILTSETRQKWLNGYDYVLPYPDSKKIKVKYMRANKAVSQMGTLFGRKPNRLASFTRVGLDYNIISADETTPISQLLAQAKAAFPRYGRAETRSRGHNFTLLVPTFGETAFDPDLTVGETGLIDGDLLILHRDDYRKFRHPSPIANMNAIAPAYDTNLDFRNRWQRMIKSVLDPEEKRFKYHNGALTGLILYDDSHTDAALFFRNYFDQLIQWSERLFELLVLETTGETEQSSLSRYWQAVSGKEGAQALAFLGMCYTKPLSAETLTPITDSLHLDTSSLPALILFDDLLRPDKITIPLAKMEINAISEILDQIEIALRGADLTTIHALLGREKDPTLTPFYHLKQRFDP